MAAFSGKKYSVHKTQDRPPEDFAHETGENRQTFLGDPRSGGKKFVPVRISTAFFEGHSGSKNPSSSRKTMGLSARKPIRNIHKLLESPKRTARKRLDYSKPKENFNPIMTKAQVSSAKKIAPKTPVPTVTSVKKSDRKTTLSKYGANSRHSRLLPPGTIAGTYVNGRNSLAPSNSISKLPNKRFTLAHKIPQPKRPSDVPEESPQPLESSYEAEKLSSLNTTGKKLPEALKGVDSKGSINNHKETESLKEKEKLLYCCKCSQTINESRPSKEANDLASTSIRIQVNSEDIMDPGSMSDKNKFEGVYERPTVIVMQSEVKSQMNKDNFEELINVPTQDGSYSEILSLQPSANSSRVDESLLFKKTETACTRLEIIKELNSDDKATGFIFELISTNKKILLEQQTYLTDSISQYESNLKRMKLMLENVDAQLEKQETLESSMKLKEFSDFRITESSPISKKNSHKTSSESTDNSESDSKVDSPRGKKQKKNRRSSRSEPGVEIQEENDSARNVLSDLNQDDNKKIENIENEPPQRRRSARLAIKNNDISLPIEHSTPATGKKKSTIMQAKSKPCTPSMTTPARNAKWGRRSERPLREYMVLKSAIKFLNTPDSRRIRIGSDEKLNIRDSLDKTDQALLSDKLLKELHELYATP